MAQNGYLTARIYTSKGSLPVLGALVTVTANRGDSVAILGKRTTDKNGLIEPIAIAAPDVSLSLEPGDMPVYTTVDVRVDKELFYTVIIKNVQIFARQTTIVDTPLVPLPQNQDYGGRADEFVETPQNL